MRLTQKDIAKNLGISLVTVNRAFNNSGYVSPELKKRIFDYARRQSYVPHRASQILVRNTLRTIAVFSSSLPGYFWDDIKSGVLKAAEYIRPFNYEVHYHRVPDFDTEGYCARLRKEIKEGLNAAAFVNQGIFDMKRILALVEKADIPYLMFNVDDRRSGRLCYIGSDYRAGGRLAANFIGKSLSLKRGGKVLVIGQGRENLSQNDLSPDINMKRFEGFMEIIGEFPGISCKTAMISSRRKDPRAARQIRGLMAEHEGKTDAVYFIPAFNEALHETLDRYDYRRTLTVQHDIDDSAIRHLEKNLLTAVVYQDPVLQGYTAVKTLETILESKTREVQRDIEIAHTLIFKENVNYLKNHYLLSDFEG
jgi:LacI family transcriptional regulator